MLPRAGHEAVRVLPELGQLLRPAQARVLELVARRLRLVEAAHQEPARVPRLRPAGAHVAEGPEGRAHVVEDAVQDDLHLPPVAFLDEAQEARGRPALHFQVDGIGRVLGGPEEPVAFGVGPEVVVDVVEEGRIQLEGRRRLEDGGEEERRHPERLDVVEALDEPLQVAPVAAGGGVPVEVVATRLLPGLEAVPVAGPGRGLPVAHGLVRPGAANVGRTRVVARVAVAETLEDDLVDDGVRGPVGRGVAEGGGGSLRGSEGDQTQHEGGGDKKAPRSFRHSRP